MRRRRAGWSVLATVMVASLAGCATDTIANNAVQTESVTVTMTAERSTGTSEPTAESAMEPTGVSATPTTETSGLGLEALVADIEQHWGAQVQIAVMTPERVESAGNFTPLPAWSTIKVPLAVAALRNDPSLSTVALSAIAVSDNEAAERLWESLGGGEAAAEAVEKALRESGDTTTRVNPQVTRPGFTAFGQTVWPLEAQVGYAQYLSSAPGAAEAEVRSAMEQIAPTQAYGIGQLPGSHFKGGWGPEPTGPYLVRQFGFVDGQALAIATIAADGTYEGGQRVLNDAVAKLGAYIEMNGTVE